VAEPDEQRLVEKLRTGSREACAELIHTHYQNIYRFLVRLTRETHWAEDLTQETFATAWEKIATFRGHATLSTWLHQIAYRKFVDSRRAAQRAQRMRQRLTSSPGTADNPLEMLQSSDEARFLNEALDEMDESHRTVLVLHYLQGLSYREMATVLDEPTGTVKWRTLEALKRLRELLGDEVSNHATRKTS
jgi:RNA polymerase sigma-70 factor (ECF subfamily)